MERAIGQFCILSRQKIRSNVDLRTFAFAVTSDSEIVNAKDDQVAENVPTKYLCSEHLEIVVIDAEKVVKKLWR